jgi:predicted DsbA family dithiol-disulfide isomerase
MEKIMAKMQFFYDYECPFCKIGYEYLMEQIGSHPEIEIEWRPVEAHPEPEDVHPHTYLVCQGYYAAKELGADMSAFHAAMFRAISAERQDVERPELLCDVLKGIVDTGKFRAVLESGKYAKQVDENNDLAYEKSGVWYLPAFRMNGKKLDAKGGVGISPKELKTFLLKC